MKIPRRTFAAIVGRALDAQRPRLFDDSWSAKRARRRLDLLKRWAGPAEFAAARDVFRGIPLSYPERCVERIRPKKSETVS